MKKLICALLLTVGCGASENVEDTESHLEPGYEITYVSHLKLTLNSAVGTMPAGHQIDSAANVRIGQPSFRHNGTDAFTAHRTPRLGGRMTCAIGVVRYWGYPDAIVPTSLLQYGRNWQQFWSSAGGNSRCTIIQPNGTSVVVSVATDSYRIYRTVDAVTQYNGVEVFRPMANGYFGTFKDAPAILNTP